MKKIILLLAIVLVSGSSVDAFPFFKKLKPNNPENARRYQKKKKRGMMPHCYKKSSGRPAQFQYDWFQ